MILDDLMQKNGLSRYRLAVTAGIPHATLNDICSGKTKLERCSAETVYKLAKTLGVSMEQLTESGIRETQREHSYEYGLPDYLQHDLDTYKEGLKTHSPLLDCYCRLSPSKVFMEEQKCMSSLIDFTNCKRVYGKAYNGANGKKIAVIYDGNRYMIKFPPSGEHKPTDLSYTNSCISEYIACHIFNLLGIQAQKTLLGTFQVAKRQKSFVLVKISL